MANKLFDRFLQRTYAAGLIAIALMGCAADKGMIPGALYSTPDVEVSKADIKGADSRKSELAVTVPPAPPAPTKTSSVTPSAPVPAKVETADINLMFDQIPLPSFIQVTFGTILKKNYSVDPQVATRTDLVTLRTGSAQTPTQVLATAIMLLKTYGIAVTELGGFYRIAPDTNQSAYAPEIRRGRAQPDVPLPLRPIFNLIELTSVKSSDIANPLRYMFGQKITIQEDSVRNAIMISGLSTDVNAALEAIQVLDQPMMRGRSSRRIAPASLSADELSKKLVEVLGAEGYSISTSLGVGAAIMLVPVPTSNSLLVFGGDPAVLDHVVAWAKQLDQADNSDRRSGGYFTYPVKYSDAQDLAKTMQEILASAPAPAPVAATGGAAATARAPSKIVVNTASNTLIFVSSQDQYMQLLGILKELDQPSKSALIEVTVAEVNVTDANQLGVEWTMNPISQSNGNILAQTAGGLSLQPGGLTVNFLNSASQVRATLNALASAKKGKILSTPRVMARNGETATISVGDQVPIITSQLSNANTQVGGTTGSTGGILQTVQYLPTGVILKVKPIIHSGNRVELDVSQEVSAASTTTTGVNTSPTITSRKVDTKLSIRDGATVLLGGLMSSDEERNDTGIPLLKDIPGLGQLFRTNKNSINKTELIVLITPYIIDDDLVAEQVTKAFRDELGPWAQTAPGSSPMQKIVPIKEVAPQNDAPTVPAVPTETTVPAASSSEPVIVQPVIEPNALPATTGAQVTNPALLEELRKASSATATPAKTVPNKKP